MLDLRIAAAKSRPYTTLTKVSPTNITESEK